MSNRDEIRRKKELQARFQVSLASLDSKIVSWMGEDKGGDEKRLAEERKDFEALPIIAQGKGLNMGDDEDEEETAVKVKDFVRGNEKSKKAGKAGRIAKIKQAKPESRSMRALRNKLRDTKRDTIRKEAQEKEHKKCESSSEDDDDDELDLRAKKVVKGRRPF